MSSITCALNSLSFFTLKYRGKATRNVEKVFEQISMILKFYGSKVLRFYGSMVLCFHASMFPLCFLAKLTTIWKISNCKISSITYSLNFVSFFYSEIPEKSNKKCWKNMWALWFYGFIVPWLLQFDALWFYASMFLLWFLERLTTILKISYCKTSAIRVH